MKFTDALTWARDNPGRQVFASGIARRMIWHASLDCLAFRPAIGLGWSACDIVGAHMLDADWHIVPEKMPSPDNIRDPLGEHQRAANAINNNPPDGHIVEEPKPVPEAKPSAAQMEAEAFNRYYSEGVRTWTYTPSALGAKDMPAGESKPAFPNWMRGHEVCALEQRLSDAEKLIDRMADWESRIFEMSRCDQKDWLARQTGRICEAVAAYRSKWPKGKP